MRWRIAEQKTEDIRKALPDLHPVVARLLWNRGITTPDEAQRFLYPDYERDLHDPFLFRDMRRACERIWTAIEKGEKVVVHGDYDADGISGSVVLMTTFRTLAKTLGRDPSLFTSYLPHREKEGYGVRLPTIDKLADEGNTLMITVDCGISCAEEIAHAKTRGIDTIVVDHHQIPPRIPECIIIHPWVEGETYPYKYLAAVGVAFKFACALNRFAAERGTQLEPGFEKWLLDLVSIATVTDVVKLVGENRTLEHYGLKVLNKTRRPGFKQLFVVAGLVPGNLDTTSVGFAIGPRINAASRMEHAKLAYDTLMAETDEDAARLAERLNQVNKDRQRYTEEIMTKARVKVAERGVRPIQVVAGDGWSAGIVGLVAGKLVGELGIPVFAFGKEGDKYVGSGRSIPEFNVVAGMEQAREFLFKFGGHPQACGLTIMGEANFNAFRDSIEAYAAKILVGREPAVDVRIDAELAASQVTWELVDMIGKLAPHGEGNPLPKFLLSDLLISEIAPVGKTGKHVRILARGDIPRERKFICFNMADRCRELLPGSRIDAVVEIGINEWMGRKDIQLKVVDLRPAESLRALAGAVAHTSLSSSPAGGPR